MCVAVLFIPVNGARKGRLNRAGLETKFIGSFGAIHKHLVPGHSNPFQWNSRLAVQHTRKNLIGIPGSHREGVRQPNSRAGPSTDACQFVENFLEQHITAAQNISFSNAAALRSNAVSQRNIFDGNPVQTRFHISRNSAVQKIYDDASCGRWCAKYVQGAYRRWFVEGLEAGSEPNISQSIAEAGQDPERVIAVANSKAIVTAYEAATDEARRLNIFGAPTFIVDDEVFWGDDRLDDAIAWRQNGKLGSRLIKSTTR